MRGKLLECTDPDVAECICNLGSSLVSRSSFAGPLRRDIPLAFAPPKASTHLPYPSSQAPLWAGEWFVSQCKYSFSLSKTYFPTTVKRRGGCFKRGGGEDRESVCVRVFWEWGLPPFSPPSLVCCCLPVLATSGTVYHLACWFRQKEKRWNRNTVPIWGPLWQLYRINLINNILVLFSDWPSFTPVTMIPYDTTCRKVKTSTLIKA